MAIDGLSDYNSLQASVNKRYSHGFTVQANYTWSKAMTTTGGRAVEFPQRQLNYGPSSFDHTQRFVVSYVWQAPDVTHQLAAVSP